MRAFRGYATWQFTAVVVLLCLFGQPSDARDSAEVVAVGKCLWQAGPCEGWDWTYRPPLPPMLAALLPFEGSAGVVLVSLLATAAWVFPARRLLRGEGAGWALVVAMAATPGIRTAAMVGDPRCLGVLALLASAAAVVEQRWLLGGFLAGVAALCRVENLVATGCVVFLAGSVQGMSTKSAVAAGKAALLAAAGGVLAIAPWTAAISWKIGRFTVVSRAWEGAAAGWSETLTLPLVHLWVGPSAWEGPLRDALRAAPSSVSIVEISSVVPALWAAVALSVPVWLGVGAVASLVVVGATRRSSFSLMAAAMLLAPPTLLSLATRPGRESPEASFVAVLALFAVWADFAVGGFQSEEATRRRAKRSVLRLAVAAAWGVWAATGLLAARGVPPRERTAANLALAERLRASGEKAPVGAVFATSHIIREAEREWYALDGRGVPQQMVIAQGDDPWAVFGLLVPTGASVTVSDRFGGDGWAVLLDVGSSAAEP